MKLSSVRSLKRQILSRSLVGPAMRASALPATARITASALPESPPDALMALGVSKRGSQYRLALRIQSVIPGLHAMVEEVTRRARGEVEVKMVGNVVKQVPWHQRRNRPLLIGGSIGHIRITAGTLGCFVTRSKGRSDEDFILSNNHVLANENNARKGDTILQPGKADNGRSPKDRIGSLHRFIRLKRRGNLVDAAIARMDGGLEYYPTWVEGIGEIAGARRTDLVPGEIVYKVGRTTGLRRGRVSAVEVSGLRVGYDTGVLSFDDQIEIEPDGGRPFSLGGDSGSLILDAKRRAVGLLFAGNDVDATYANPIRTVFRLMKLKLTS